MVTPTAAPFQVCTDRELAARFVLPVRVTPCADRHEYKRDGDTITVLVYQFEVRRRDGQRAVMQRVTAAEARRARVGGLNELSVARKIAEIAGTLRLIDDALDVNSPGALVIQQQAAGAVY